MPQVALIVGKHFMNVKSRAESAYMSVALMCNGAFQVFEMYIIFLFLEIVLILFDLVCCYLI